MLKLETWLPKRIRQGVTELPNLCCCCWHYVVVAVDTITKGDWGEEALQDFHVSFLACPYQQSGQLHIGSTCTQKLMYCARCIRRCKVHNILNYKSHCTLKCTQHSTATASKVHNILNYKPHCTMKCTQHSTATARMVSTRWAVMHGPFWSYLLFN